MGREGIALEGPPMPDIDLAHFKSALSSFATGVTLAATAVGSELP